jgi:hypothetical protein
MFDLRIYDFSPSNPASSSAGGEVQIHEKWLYRRETPYFYGRYYNSPLEFDFTVGSYSIIDGTTRDAIQAWLLGKSTYLPLRIVQDDISDITFNVILTRQDNIYIGNLNYALTLHARCDRPWGLYYPPILTRTYSGANAVETIEYYNESVYSGYNKPTISFTMGGSGGDLSIINETDGDREFLFSDLSPNEVITVDNDKGIITSSGSSLRIQNFNKNFLRLVQGENILSISGSITQLTFDTVFAKGIGA